jgi:hypothetical protein
MRLGTLSRMGLRKPEVVGKLLWGSQQGNQQGQRFWSALTQVSAVLAGIASATYILGILALFIPIVDTYSLTFTRAWYATLLVSRNLVVVQGVSQLLWPLVSLWLSIWF